MSKSLQNIIIGDIIKVQAYKYNGHLYRQWNGAKVLENQPDHVVLALLKTKVSDDPKQHWSIREPTLWFFPKNGFYNATILVRDEGNFVYNNLASPPIYEDDVLKFIDFDLDIKAYPGKAFTVVDIKEFEENSKKYNYDNDLVKVISNQVKKLEKMAKHKRYFFNEKIIQSYVYDLIKMKFFRRNKRKKKQ